MLQDVLSLALTIRDVCGDDFPLLHAFDVAGFPIGIAYSRRRLRAHLERPGAVGLLLERDGAVTGYALGHVSPDGEAHIISLLVDKQSRRFGLGTRLTHALEARFAEAGADHVVLEARADDPAAIAFWRGQGYRPVGEVAGQYVDHAAPMIAQHPQLWGSQIGRWVLDRRRLANMLHVPRSDAVAMRKPLLSWPEFQ